MRGSLPFRSVLSQFPTDSISGLRAVYLQHVNWVHMPLSSLMARPLSILDAAEQFGVECLMLTNSMAGRLVAEASRAKRQWSLGSVRSVLLGAETIVPRIARNLAALLARNGAPGASIRGGYGATETGPLVTGADPAIADGNDEAAPLGGCAAGVALRIVDENDGILDEGEIGEVQALCPQTIFSGYFGEAEAGAPCFTEDGWWRSGDLGRLQNGSLTLRGRAKDVLVWEGRKISLAEIDACLQTALGDGLRAYSCALVRPFETTESLAVVFVLHDRLYDVDLVAEEIRRLIARRFGLPARPVVPARIDQIPKTGAGKLRRQELAARLLSGFFGVLDPPTMRFDPSWRDEALTAETCADQIWTEVFGQGSDADPDANFFDLGGDSLRASLLFMLIEERLGLRIQTEAFFSIPTLHRLRQLVEEGAPRADDAEPPGEISVLWPLQDDLRRRQLAYVETWDGVRPTRDRLVAGLNVAGAKPPLFWCFQGALEFRRLAERLGPDQPVYAFRSGHLLIEYTEDEIQALALRYVHEILEVCPEGPLFVGGNCQGGLIALAMAQHLLRRRRHVPLLILMEWSFALQTYAGPVLLLYGRDSLQGNPYKRFRYPEVGWRRVFGDFATEEISGAHGQFFDTGNVDSLSKVLARRLDEACAKPPKLLPGFLPYVLHAVDGLPERMSVGEQRRIELVIENCGRQVWSSESSGLFLSNYWVDLEERVVEPHGDRVHLPELPPGARTNLTLTITAPSFPGTLRLVVDLVEEGSHWIDPKHRSALHAQVVIA